MAGKHRAPAPPRRWCCRRAWLGIGALGVASVIAVGPLALAARYEVAAAPALALSAAHDPTQPPIPPRFVPLAPAVLSPGDAVVLAATQDRLAQDPERGGHGASGGHDGGGHDGSAQQGSGHDGGHQGGQQNSGHGGQGGNDGHDHGGSSGSGGHSNGGSDNDGGHAGSGGQNTGGSSGGQCR